MPHVALETAVRSLISTLSKFSKPDVTASVGLPEMQSAASYF